MASNDQWPPVSLAASAKASAKTNGNKRHIKESQQDTLAKLNEMFASTLEPGVILSVVQNCNWELQPSIEGLITLSETVEDPLMWNDSTCNIGEFENQEDSKKNNEKKIVEKDHVSSSRESLSSVQSSWEEVSRGKTWGKPKRSGTKNRMDSFCGNIAKLKSSAEKIGESGKSLGRMKEQSDGSNVAETDPMVESASGATRRAPLPTTMHSQEVFPGKLPDEYLKSKTLSSEKEKKAYSSPGKRGNNTREKHFDSSERSVSPEESKDSSEKNQKVARFDNKMNMRKNESESLCGLKVQYRLNGMSSSDDDNEDEDDDADVVIEDETSDYAINLTSAITSSVSQFLSPLTQTPPRGTRPEIHMINTPSPPMSPQRSVHDAAFARIRAAITRGDKILVLLRGLPGSGKTTLAKSLVATTVGGDVASHVFSADDFFVTLGRGVYKFDPAKLPDAHTSNRSRVSKAIRDGRSPIIVDNTNIEAWEMRPYAAMAVDGGYIVEILEPNTPWARNPKQLAEKNTHNVTKTKIMERALKYEFIPSGQKLLDKFGLKYPKRNEPSLRVEREKSRDPAPAPPPPPPPPHCMADLKSNWENDDKNNYVLTSHDIESMQNIDETRYKPSNVEQSPIDIDRPSNNDYTETNLPEEVSTYADRVFEDYLKELQDSDDESFEIVDGSGTENRSSFEQCVRDESTSGSSSSYEIAKDTLSETNNDCGTKDSNSQQTLGAIGSERKFNHSTATINSDESGNEQVENKVLSQCWDFTLVHGGRKLHSRHGHYVSLFKKNASYETAGKLDPGVSQNENILEKNEEFSTVKEINCNSQCESITKISLDENEDEASNEENLVEAFFPTKSDEKTAGPDIDSEQPADDTVRELSTYEATLSTASENSDDDSPKKTMFDVILNLLKTPNPAASEESSTTVYGDAQSGESMNSISFGDQVHRRTNNEDNSTNEKEEEEEQKQESSANAGTTNLINLDVVDSPKEWKKLGGMSDGDRETTLKNVSTNPFRTAEMLTDNINSISWKESPFPVDDSKIPTIPVMENEIPIVKVDAQTMTTLYDFNVAYVGGTSEPGYREVLGVSRSINEGAPIPKTIENRTSNVVTFDKSSMTGEIDILAGEVDPSVEKEKDSTNRLDDLIEMFPLYPREYLKTLYEQQCNCNFDWVVDVLILADVPNLTIENYEKHCSPKLSKIEHEKLNQRSHSFSPKNRRNRVKDLRSFSLECVKDSAGENDSDNNPRCYEDEDKLFELFYNKALSDKNPATPQNLDSSEAASSSSIAAGASSDDDSSETMELNFGRDFINQLEKTCGNPDFVLPDEFKPVIKIKKSLVDELYGLWIESMDHQMKVLHARLDERMAKDEAMARAMDREESVKSREPVVPNLEEIMNMEMALARYHNELKENMARETQNDMASRLTRQTLYELLPDIDKEMLSQLLTAHGGNFKETCEIIEANIGRTISKSDSLKKQQSLLKRVHEESQSLGTQEESSSSLTTPVIVVNPDIRTSADSDRYHYQDAIARAQDARMEAQVQASLRIENYNKAAEAYRKGLPGVAAYYSQMVKLHTENIKAAHANAAEELVAAQTFTQNGEDTLDLHNLFVREALQALNTFLDYQLKKLNRSTKKSATFYVITGYGARSNHKLGRIKPAVTKKLISKNIRFTEANRGCLKVTINRRNGTFD